MLLARAGVYDTVVLEEIRRLGLDSRLVHRRCSSLLMSVSSWRGRTVRRALKQQLRDLDSGIALSNRVSAVALDAVDRQQLQWALRKTGMIHDLLSVPDVYA